MISFLRKKSGRLDWKVGNNMSNYQIKFGNIGGRFVAIYLFGENICVDCHSYGFNEVHPFTKKVASSYCEIGRLRSDTRKVLFNKQALKSLIAEPPSKNRVLSIYSAIEKKIWLLSNSRRNIGIK